MPHDNETNQLASVLLEAVRALDPNTHPAPLVASALEPLRYEAPTTDSDAEDWTAGIGNTFA